MLSKNQFKSWKIGLLGSLFLILSPRIFAHSFYNSKDIPFLSVFIISIYTLPKYQEKKTLLRISLHASASAILTGIRILGIIVPFFTFFFTATDLLKSKSRKITIEKATTSLLIYLLLFIFLTILVWPILWTNPAHHSIQAFKEMRKYPWGGYNFYLGRLINATNLPWHYLPLWIIITTPLIYTCFFFIGLFFSIKFFLKKPMIFYSNNKIILIALLWFFFPLADVIVLKSVIYDGWRHMFFIYPALLMISLTGLIYLYRFIKIRLKRRTYKIINSIIILIVILSLINIIHFMIKYHPYQNIYFNKLAGKKIEIFELDYWGLSYRKALEYILKNDTSRSIKIYVESLPGRLNAQLLPPQQRDRLIYVKTPDEAEYFLSDYRWNRNHPFKEEYYSIKIDSTRIMVVYKLKSSVLNN